MQRMRTTNISRLNQEKLLDDRRFSSHTCTLAVPPLRFVRTTSRFRIDLCPDLLLLTYTMPSTKNLVLKFTKVVPNAFSPSKGSAKAAGFDLKSANDYIIPARGKEIVDTGIKVELPEGCYGRVAPRSGLAAKNFIDVGAGVIDEDYRGIIKVVLFNHSEIPFEVKKGDRIAQLICERIYYPDIEESKELTDTQRGEGGFGSTGTN